MAAVRAKSGCWRVEVWDTGIGVAKGSEGDIYQPYFRQEHAWTINSAGHGLGLSVVARCAKLMGLPYGIDSRLGQGSCFWVSLAQAQVDPSAAWLPFETIQPPGATAPKAASFLPPLGQGSCLIVEDDPQVCGAWQALLSGWGVTAHIATNAKQAFEVVHAGHTLDAILCDERLRAGESGFELLKALQQRLPHARGAMVSGEFSSPAIQQAEDEGYLVLRKPVDIQLLHSLLSRWLVK